MRLLLSVSLAGLSGLIAAFTNPGAARRVTVTTQTFLRAGATAHRFLCAAVAGVRAFALVFFPPPQAAAKVLPMSSTTPVSPQLDALGRILVDVAVRQFLRNSNKALVAPRAQAIISISSALELVDTGDPTGAAALATAIEGAASVTAQSDPGLADALQTLCGVVASAIAPFAKTAAGAILDNINVAIFTEMASIAQGYLPAAPATPAS